MRIELIKARTLSDAISSASRKGWAFCFSSIYFSFTASYRCFQMETKTAKTVALTVQEIETMGKKATFGNNITLTPDECDTLKRYAVNGIIANADNKRLKEKLASAEKTVSIWKQRYEAVNEKYMKLKQKAQPFLDALEIASEKVRAFINSILIRGKQTQEHEHPARKRGQDMEL